MWTRAELKEKGKTALKRNYWMCVLVALILAALVDGAFSRPSSSRQETENSEEAVTVTVNGMELDDPELQAQLQEIANSRVPGPVTYIAQNFLAGLTPQKAGLLGLLGVGLAIPAILLNLLVINVLEIGGCRFFLRNTHEKARFDELAYGFRNNYGNAVVTQFMRSLKTFLWALLLVIPGIVKSYEYMMIPYLLADDPGISRQDAFLYSRKMMEGNKWNAFVLDLSYILWALLGAVTFGIANVLWTYPYRYCTRAELYLTLRDQTFGER